MNLNIIDLFAGCGGFSVGFKKAGFKVTKAVEFDPKIAEIYRINHPDTKLFVEDIGKINNETNFQKNEVDIIIGGPPCQGFSMAGARIRNGFVEDPRNYLFKQYLKVVQIVKPKYFIIENVKGILTMNEGKIFDEILNVFSDENNFEGDRYYLHYKIINAVEYGIPQKRERVIIIGSKNKDFDYSKLIEKAKAIITSEHPRYFEKVSVWDAIGNLPQPTSDGIVKNPKSLTNYQKYLSSSKRTISNHTTPNHNKKTYDRMKLIGQGENFAKLNEKINSIHSGSYGRLEKNGVCPTITTRFDTPSGGCYTHPIENRTITQREAARLQSFPDDFIFKGNKMIICKTIGNAVPPKISYVFGVAMKEMLKDE